MHVYLVVVPLCGLIAWLAWLRFCSRIADKHPNQVELITRVAGGAFPLVPKRRASSTRLSGQSRRPKKQIESPPGDPSG